MYLKWKLTSVLEQESSLAMQYPSEVTGVTNADFLRSAINAKREEGDEISLMRFIRELDSENGNT